MKIIAVAGGHASGKSLFARYLVERLSSASLMPLGNYYLEKSPQVSIEQHNFSVPNAFDFKTFHKDLEELRAGLPVQMPQYELRTGRRTAKVRLGPADYLILEGLYALMTSSIRSILSYSFFLESDPDITLSRYILRDYQEHGLPPDYSIQQYFTYARPAYLAYILPTRQHAQYVLNNDFSTRLDAFLDEFLGKYQL